MKKIFTVILVVSLCLAIFVGCNSEKASDQTMATESSSEFILEAKTQSYTINYPQNMNDFGFTEPVVLKKKPTRVVSLSNSPVLALYEMGIEMIAVPETTVIDWPQDLDEKAIKLNTAMNEAFDIETVVALSPDLVFLGKTQVETYGKILTSVNIPVYYVDAGHTVPYDSIKMLTNELLDAFGENSDAANNIKADFVTLEKRLDELKIANEGRTVMVLQSSPPAHYIQTQKGTLGSMLDMMGFTNVYENDQASLVPLDFERAISYDPDIFFAVGRANTSDEFKGIMEDDFTNNPDYWNSIEAVKNGNTLYMPASFIASAGINVIDKIAELADMIEEYDTR